MVFVGYLIFTCYAETKYSLRTGSNWRLRLLLRVLKCFLFSPLHFPTCSISVWMPGVSKFPCSFPFVSMGSSFSWCWFISMPLVLHSTEIWLGMRQTPVEWRTTEPMDRPYFTRKTQASLWHVNIPSGEAQLVHLLCSNRGQEAWNYSWCFWGCSGLKLWVAPFPSHPAPSLFFTDVSFGLYDVPRYTF